MKPNGSQPETEERIKEIDDHHSKRFISLDPEGYFLIKINYELKILIVEHFKNNIDDTGRSIDPETGEIIECSNEVRKSPFQIFTGRSAKEIGIKITENDLPLPISKLDHAMYLGRELQKAEYSLIHGTSYIQD